MASSSSSSSQRLAWIMFVVLSASLGSGILAVYNKVQAHSQRLATLEAQNRDFFRKLERIEVELEQAPSDAPARPKLWIEPH